MTFNPDNGPVISGRVNEEGSSLVRMEPDLFNPDAVDPEIAALNSQIVTLLEGLPDITKVPPEQTRAARESGESVFGPLEISERAHNRIVNGPDGPVAIRVFDTDHPEGVFLHIHGGGWVLGGAHQQDPWLEAIADECSLTVVSVEYRLAPENKYPAGLDDCETVALWLAETAEDEFGTSRLMIGGESAGANLSAATLLRLRDRHTMTPFSGANLVYGSYDMRMTPSGRHWTGGRLVLDPDAMSWFAELYLNDPTEVEQPYVSPLLADLSSMPPALFTVGTADPLLDDSLFMHARWIAAGNRGELAIYPGGCHAFDAFPTALAVRARARMHAFLRSV